MSPARDGRGPFGSTVSRPSPLTPPSGTWAFDPGLGVGHAPGPPDVGAAGIDPEAAVVITDRVELGEPIRVE